MELFLIVAVAGAIYLGTGVFCASRWFHRKDPISVILVILFWPVIFGLSFFVK